MGILWRVLHHPRYFKITLRKISMGIDCDNFPNRVFALEIPLNSAFRKHDAESIRQCRFLIAGFPWKRENLQKSGIGKKNPFFGKLPVLIGHPCLSRKCAERSKTSVFQ